MKLYKFEPKKELILVVISLLWMWFSYYASDHILENNIILNMIVSVPLTMIGNCVVLPVWWVAVHNKEGIEGLNITGKRLALTIIFTLSLSAWRFLELKQFLGSDNLITSLLFNGLAIWEVLFIFGWMFTRYEISFGKIPAILLTTVSVGLYHIGTLTIGGILHLCLVICICSICYCFTENIFTFTPLYWPIGTSASTLASGMVLPADMIGMCVIILVIQLIIITALQIKYLRINKKSIV